MSERWARAVLLALEARQRNRLPPRLADPFAFGLTNAEARAHHKRLRALRRSKER